MLVLLQRLLCGHTYKLPYWEEWDVERRVNTAHGTPGDSYVTSEERSAEPEM